MHSKEGHKFSFVCDPEENHCLAPRSPQMYPKGHKFSIVCIPDESHSLAPRSPQIYLKEGHKFSTEKPEHLFQ